MDNDDFRIGNFENACIVTLVSPNNEGRNTDFRAEKSLVELRELLRTLDTNVVHQLVQRRNAPDAATFLGRGKLEELKEQIDGKQVDVIVFDCELTGSQVRNINKIMEIDVIDRCQVILQIFAEHARTREAKIQIEISRLQYLLPRLSSLWSHFTRQKGGIGLKGEGEQQLELDRRLIRRKISRLKDRLKTVEKSRTEQRKRRSNSALTAALVGYTNAGKSTLMNALCRSQTLAEDKLFATLDSTFRMLSPNTKPPLVLIDTVGFIANLPSTLIEGFKTTLESAMEAELLIVVVDASDPDYQNQLKVTESTLDELKLGDKNRFYVFNKVDQVQDQLALKLQLRSRENSFAINAFSKDDIDSLRKTIINQLLKDQPEFEIFVPYAEGAIHSVVNSKTNVINQSNHEDGIFYKIQTPEKFFSQLGLASFETSSRVER